MVGIPLAYGQFSRRRGRLPVFASENVFAEKEPTDQAGGYALIGRPGLTAFATTATGPVRAMYQQAGIFDGDRFVLAGTVLYRIASNGVQTAASGTVAGLERAKMAADLDSVGESVLRIVTGTEIYVYDGTSVAAETFAGTAGASDIDAIGGAFFAIHTDTQEIYFRYRDDTGWAALAFESSEYKPDKAVAITHLGDQVIVAGEASTEVFALSGDADFPLDRYGSGLLSEIGCRARDSVVRLPDAVYMVGADCQVWRLSPAPQAVSDPGLVETLRGAAANTFVAWGYVLDGHEHYVLNTEVGSFVYDSLTGLWSKASSYGYDYWRPWFATQVADRVLVADGIGTGDLWYLDPDTQDDAGEPIQRRFAAWLEIKEGRLEVSSLVANCAAGWGDLYSDQIEATNLFTYSEQFDNAAWLNSGVTVTANAVAGPTGHYTADKLDDPNASDNFIYRIETVADDAQPYAISIYLKPGSAAVSRFDVALSGGTGVSSVSTITWSGPSVSGSGAGTLTSVGGGWYRLTAAVTNNATGNTTLTVALRPAGITAASTGYCYAWGAQLEHASSATAYIATLASTVSRYALLDPKLKVRAYRDGVTAGAWREVSLGTTGHHDADVRLNRWGQFKAPGALFEFECSDAVALRVSDIRANVP
jgi:hypothetical protein